MAFTRRHMIALLALSSATAITGCSSPTDNRAIDYLAAWYRNLESIRNGSAFIPNYSRPITSVADSQYPFGDGFQDITDIIQKSRPKAVAFENAKYQDRMVDDFNKGLITPTALYKYLDDSLASQNVHMDTGLIALLSYLKGNSIQLYGLEPMAHAEYAAARKAGNAVELDKARYKAIVDNAEKIAGLQGSVLLYTGIDHTGMRIPGFDIPYQAVSQDKWQAYGIRNLNRNPTLIYSEFHNKEPQKYTFERFADNLNNVLLRDSSELQYMTENIVHTLSQRSYMSSVWPYIHLIRNSLAGINSSAPFESRIDARDIIVRISGAPADHEINF
jgi:hypothetical protein